MKFIELEADHLIPIATSEARLAKLRTRFALGADFALNGTRNLVPVHGRCNRRKSSLEFRESTIRYYVDLWDRRQVRVEKELAAIARVSKNDRILATLAARVEAGHISVEEITSLLAGVSTPMGPDHEPIVVCFSLHVGRLKQGTPGHSHSDLVDTLIVDLHSKIDAVIPALHVETENDRNGDTASVRIAFWNLDIKRLERFKGEPWEIVEVAWFHEIYDGGDWRALFPRAAIHTYHGVLRNDEDVFFGLSRCPTCGNEDLERRTATSPHDGDNYYFIECPKCGYSDWTQ